MIENYPKTRPGGVTLSNEIIEINSKLINKNKKLPTTQKLLFKKTM